eukprot:TRINITY_DN14627_c0_g1_i1.p1 TRINITY_DN14627_c0_g1~~TRINITY_DN14627_c0_g1_i1.p1  ORF type:complete len:575 (+),score=66.72 TRINITY_DN14627_c0_g1_i1:94-1818(+)
MCIRDRLKNVPVVPVSGLLGINLISSGSQDIPWYTGPNLMQALTETVPPADQCVHKPLRVSIKHVYKVPRVGQVMLGVVMSGRLCPGMPVSVSPGSIGGTVGALQFLGVKTLGFTWLRMWRLVALGRAQCTDPLLSRLFDVDRISFHVFELIVSQAHNCQPYEALPGDHVTFQIKGAARVNTVQRGDVLCDQLIEPARGCISFFAFVVVVSQRSGGVAEGFQGQMYYGAAATNCRIKKILCSLDRSGKTLESRPDRLRKGHRGIIELEPVVYLNKKYVATPLCVDSCQRFPRLGRLVLTQSGTLVIGAIRAVDTYASRLEELAALADLRRMQTYCLDDPELGLAALMLPQCARQIPTRDARCYRSLIKQCPKLSTETAVCVARLSCTQHSYTIANQLISDGFSKEQCLKLLAFPHYHGGDAGFDIKAKTLCRLVQARHMEGVALLLAAGVDPLLATYGGENAISFANTETLVNLEGCDMLKPLPLRFSLPVCDDIVACLQASLVWTPESHHLFPPGFRALIRYLTASYKLMARAFASRGGLYLSSQIAELIFQWLPRNSKFAYDKIQGLSLIHI